MSVVARERVSVPATAGSAEVLIDFELAPRRRRLNVVAGVGGLMLVSLLLGGQRLRTRYWVDEALTVGIAAHSIPSIPGLLVKDGSPPLYYLLLALWTRLFGTGEVATHSLSLVFAVAAVPVAFWAGDRLFGRRAAWFTAAFAGLSPFLTYFAGEARMYSLVVLESILLCVAFAVAFVERRPNGPRWFAGALGALIYTHYWGLYAAVGAGLACALLVVMGCEARSLLRPAAIGFGGAALAFLPWLPTFIGQARSTGAPWSHTPTMRGVVSELAALVRDERVLVAIVLAVGIGLLPLVQQVVRDGRSVQDRDVQKTIAILCIGALPVVLGWTLAHLQPSWATRYLAVTVGPMILLVGFGLSRAKWLGVGALALAAVLVTQPFTRISPGVSIATDSKSNAGAIGTLMSPELPPGSLVLVSQPEAVPLFEHYLGPNLRYGDPRGLVADPQVMDWRNAEDTLAATSVPGALGASVDALHAGDRVLLVSLASAVRDTDTSWIERFRQLDQQWQDYLGTRTCLTPVLRVGPQGPADTPYRATLYECR